MSTATITKSKTKSRTLRKQKELAKPASLKVEGGTCGSSTPCENCKVKSESKRLDDACKANKEPMFKLGCWRGMFKGTPDF